MPQSKATLPCPHLLLRIHSIDHPSTDRTLECHQHFYCTHADKHAGSCLRPKDRKDQERKGCANRYAWQAVRDIGHSWPNLSDNDLRLGRRHGQRPLSQENQPLTLRLIVYVGLSNKTTQCPSGQCAERLPVRQGGAFPTLAWCTYLDRSHVRDGPLSLRPGFLDDMLIGPESQRASWHGGK